VDPAAKPSQVCPACNSHYEAGVAFCPKDGTKLQPVGAAPSPSLVGGVIAERYRILRKLGEGGMGEVYEAQHVYIDKKFALKLLRPEITTNPEAVARFHQEARSASSIGHDNIVGIDDFGRLPDGSVYLAMELLSGQSLSDRLRTPPPLTLDETLAIAIQACCGLSAAHAKGIIHRDMKPENLFLTKRHGELVVKVLDFGIAKVGGEAGQQNLTRTGQVFGTPHYMSPEQALGKGLDLRSDIYSVGVILYEMATGRVPYQAESFMGILTQHITATPAPPRQLAPDRQIPVEFEQLILRAMAKEPAQRFASMDEMAQALAHLAQTLAPALGGASQAYQAISFEVRAGSGSMAPARTPSGGMLPLGGATGVGPATPPQVSGGSQAMAAVAAPVPSVAMAAQPARTGSGVGIWILILGILAATAGVVTVAVIVLRSSVKSIVRPEPVTREEPVVVVENREKVPLPPAPGAKEIEVLVDSIPAQAKILVDGKPFADAPEVVKVKAGGALEVTLHKDGFVDKSVTLDPSKDRKMIVRLERKASSHSVEKRPPPVEPPHPVVVKEPAPVIVTPMRPPKRPPPPQKGQVLDPYQ